MDDLLQRSHGYRSFDPVRAQHYLNPPDYSKWMSIEELDAPSRLDNPEVIAAYLEEAFATGDSAFIAHAIGTLARARHGRHGRETRAVALGPLQGAPPRGKTLVCNDAAAAKADNCIPRRIRCSTD